MPDIAIHQLPAAGALTGAEIVPVDDGTATVRTTVDAIRQGLATSVHGHAVADVNGLQGALNAKAPLVSPVLGGTPTAPTAPVGTNTTQLATTAFVHSELAALGSLSAQNANAVAVTGGSINGTPIGATAPSTATVTTLTATGNLAAGWVAQITSTDAGNTGRVLIGSRYNAAALQGATAAGAVADLHLNPDGGGRVLFGSVPALPSYTIATLPTATARGLIYVSDGAANRRLAVSDGTGWRWPDGAAVS
ncbi:hypothetical protein [Azospirillum rugosum]|uniref:Phage tail repeat like n=1 Tax=Azospirillum rugosum TaxID=416170 RepID=A0ABS4SNV2_9PROT|nr:hypothetical protein [Azospirillum rugosum]MBP2294246.1 hypothetical protein [Azospirillum rugosum]MDQ0527581.1 hypothetical protein [Azospirillum rugosum]